jgi:hypothetical protein
VVSITETSDDRPLSLPEGTVTPYLTAPVEPGTYRVVLACPLAGGRRLERLVTVAPGETVLVAATFLQPAALAQLLE